MTIMNQKLFLKRKEMGYTQKQMADQCGMEQATYSKKELGKTIVREEEWQLFAQILKVEADELKNDGYDEIIIPRHLYDTIIRNNIDLKTEIRVLKQLLKLLTPT